MKNKSKLILCLLLTVFLIFTLVACVPETPDTEYTVTVVKGTGGGKFKKDASCTVTATVGDNEEFVEWQINGQKVSEDVTYTFTVTADVTLTAVTKAKEPPVKTEYTVTVIGGQGGGKFESGATCQVTATVGADESFVAWKSGEIVVSTENPYSFTVTENVTLTAEVVKNFDLGALSRKWVDKDGGTLDLAAKKWSLADDFSVSAVSGEGKDMTVTCVADETSYVLKLNDDGTLDMFDSSDASAQAVYTFMPSADEFNGLRVLEEDAFILFVSELDANGKFGYTVLDGTDIDKTSVETAVTKLIFDNGKAVLRFYVAEYGMVFTLDDQGNVLFEEQSFVYAPCAELFADRYVSANGDVYELNVAANEITVNGSKTAMQLKNGIFGAGLYFADNGATLALIQTLDGVSLFGGDEVKSLQQFDASRFNGQWNGKHTLIITDGKKADVDGTEYDIVPVVVEDNIYAGFSIGSVKYTLFQIEGNDLAFRMDSSDESEKGYYFKNTFASKFAGEYTNGQTALKVDNGNGLSVTVGGDTFDNVSFVVFEDIDRSLTAPLGFNGLQNIAIALGDSGKFVIWTGADSVAVVSKNGENLTVLGGYYKQSELPLLEDKFTVGLISDTDKYTTGGTTRITVAFDFANGKVLVNDVEYAFVWSYFINNATGDERVTVSFDAEIGGTSNRCVVYPYFDEPYIRLEAAPAETSAKTTVYSLVSSEEYSKLLGTVYYLKDGDFTQSVEFKADGTLTLVRSATKTETYTDYVLTREGRSKALVVTFSSSVGIVFETSVYCDKIGVSLTIVDDVFVNEALLDAIGVYVDDGGNECLELLANTKYKYDSYGLDDTATEDTFDSIVIDGATVTCTYSSGFDPWAVNGTITFANGTATVTEDGEEPVTYNKKVDEPIEAVIPEAFFGVYVDSEGDPFVELLADKTFKYNDSYTCIDSDTEAEEFDEIKADGAKIVCSKTYSGLGGSYTVTFVFEDGSVTVTEDGESVTYDKKAETVTIPEEYFGEYVDEDEVVCIELLADGTFKYSEYGIDSDTEAETFDEIKADGNKIIGIKNYKGIVNYTVTITFENGTATVVEDDYDPVTYTKKAEEVTTPMLTPEAFVGTFEFTEGYEIAFVIELTKNGDDYTFTIVADGSATTDVALTFNDDGKQQLTFTDEYDIVYLVILDNGTLTFTDADGTEYGSASVK